MPLVTMEQILELDDATHYGIKGMRWGVRRPPGPDGTVSSSADAKKAAETAKLVRRHGTKAASNEELRALVNRINLEKDYARAVSEKSRVEKGQAKIGKILSVGKTLNDIAKFADTPVGAMLAESMGVKSSGGKHKKGTSPKKKKTD